MKTQKRAKPPTLEQRILKRLRSLAHGAGVYEFGNYGWLNAEDYDPKHVGHAMAQTKKLAWDYSDQLHDEKRPIPKLRAWEKKLIVAQGDLDGFMQASYFSIGGMLLFKAEDDAFSANYMSAMLLLGAATDRLRDFFVCATYRKSPDKWEPRPSTGGRVAPFTLPFRQAKAHLALNHDDRVSQCLLVLVPLTDRLAEFRKKRHAIAHKIATSEGRSMADLINRKRVPVVTDIDWSQIDWSKADNLELQNRRRARARTVEPIKWYKLLVEASNQAFIIEHHLRGTSEARRSG